jgi:hypothetical protein
MQWWNKHAMDKWVNKNDGWKGEIKIKYANGGRRVDNDMWDNYRFILPMRASHFRSVRKTVSITEDLGRWCDWKTCRSRCGILEASRKFCRKILDYDGLLIGCHSIPLMLSSMIWAATSIVAPAVLKNGLSRIVVSDGRHPSRVPRSAQVWKNS